MTGRLSLGLRGETYAKAYFLRLGAEIVVQNWHCRYGELDLVVKKQGKTHFIEVKTRKSLTFGPLEAAISAKKRQRLADSIDCWLTIHPEDGKNYQLDAFLIWLEKGCLEASWIEGI